MSGFTLFFAGVVLMRMRALLATQKVEARMRRMAAMNPWPFVIAAYAVTIAGATALAVLSWLAMRQAEAAADSLKAGK